MNSLEIGIETMNEELPIVTAIEGLQMDIITHVVGLGEDLCSEHISYKDIKTYIDLAKIPLLPCVVDFTVDSDSEFDLGQYPEPSMLDIMNLHGVLSMPDGKRIFIDRIGLDYITYGIEDSPIIFSCYFPDEEPSAWNEFIYFAYHKKGFNIQNLEKLVKLWKVYCPDSL